MTFKFSRRRALQGLTVGAGMVATGATGCASEEPAEDEVEGSEDAISQQGEIFKRYKKFVILVMENRSFDHLFGHLSLPEAEGGEGRTNVNGFSSLAAHTNKDLNGNKVGIWHAEEKELGDIDHEWEACHEQFGGGQMNGFVSAHQKDLVRLNDNDPNTVAICYGTTTDDPTPVPKCGAPKDPMAFYKREDTPVFHQLLDEYVLCDNWFASVMGPTWPNRYYIHAASSGSRKVNKPLSGIGTVARNSVFGAVSARARQLRAENPALGNEKRLCVDFFSDVPLLPIMFPTALGMGNGLDFINILPDFNYAHMFDRPRAEGRQALTAATNGKVFGGSIPGPVLNFIAEARRSPTFETLCREGKLPPVSFIEPPYQLAPADDHPPHNIMMGQAFVASVYKMLQNSPDWNDTLFIITYDEHGSFYDHVKPGIVNEDTDGEFRQLGFRVPAIVIGAGLKKGHVSKVQYDHCSVLSTLTHRFNLPPSNDRVRKANPLVDCVATTTNRSQVTSGGLRLARVELSEQTVLASAEIADGQKEIVKSVFRGNVPFEAKKMFTNELFETFDRLGIANIGT
jgi:hypothetical protein